MHVTRKYYHRAILSQYSSFSSYLASKMETTKLHIALLSSPGKGHLIPVIELGKRLVTRLGFRVTVLSVGTDVPISSRSLLANDLQIIPLPPVDITTLISDPTTANILTILEVMMRLSLPHMRAAISAMDSPPSVLVVDYFATGCLSLAHEFNMAKYVYVPSNAWCVALTIYSPNLKISPSEKNPVQIPGCKPVQFDDLLDAVQDHELEAYDDFVRIGSQMATADGLLTNTWDELEPITIKAFRENEDLKSAINRVPVYPIGPLIRSESGSESEVLEWLDRQPAESVLYISFGSGGNLSAKQLQELAWGLEMSQQRFIWVVRAPTQDGECDYLSQLSSSDNRADGTPYYLPNGFTTRTKDIGLLVPNWAPQAEILAHESVGGFLTHCGWNSTLESLVNGVPLIAWPLFAEQNMTAALLAEEIGVGIRAMEPSKGVVMREEIEKMVREIMDKEKGMGKGMKEKAKELKESAERALSKGGSSYDSMSMLANKWLKATSSPSIPQSSESDSDTTFRTLIETIN